MRLRLRWKLLIAIAAPLLTIYAVIGVQEYRALRRQAIDEQRNLAEAMATYYAARFDGEFRQIAQAARSTAAFLTLHPDLDEAQLYELIDANLDQDPLIYGSCIAFEPGAFETGRQLYAPYGWKGDEGYGHIDIGADAYDYTGWEWYAMIRARVEGQWTEPYFDEGAGNILMCTYSAPFFDADGGLRGVATVDIPLVPLQARMGSSELKGGLFVIVSRGGRFITHPDPELIMTTLSQRAEQTGQTQLVGVEQRIARGEAGFLRFDAFPSGAPHWAYFTPIGSAGWSFAALYPESVVMQPVYASLRRLIGFMAVELIVMMLIITAVSYWITTPIGRLASAVRRLGAGDLETRVRGVHSRDEIGDLAGGFNNMVEQLNHHVRELAAQSAAREAVESELRVARDIQKSLLPRTFPPFPERAEFDLYAVNVPARRVAGDFYDYFFVDEQHLVLIMADVSGKGVPAALFMAVTRTILRNLALTGMPPDRMMRRANEILLEDNDRGMFVTMFCGIYETGAGEMVYANAGHPPPIVIHTDGTLDRLGDSTGALVGVLPEEEWGQAAASIRVGEKLLLFTDGLPEARSPEDKMLLDDGMMRMVADYAAESPDTLCNDLAVRVDAFQHGHRVDDLTLLVLQRNDPRRAGSFDI